MSTVNIVQNAPGSRYNKQASGGNNPAQENVYSMRMWKWRGDFIVQTQLSNGATLSSGYYDTGSDGIQPIWSSNSENALLAKAVSDLRGHDFNAAIAAAELPEALEGIIKSTRAIFGSIAAFKRGDPVGALRLLSRAVQGTKNQFRGRNTRLGRHDVSDMWLATQYGYLPLMKDIQNAMEFVEKRTAPPRVYKTKFRQVQGPTVRQGGVAASINLTMLVKVELRLRWTEVVSTARSLGLWDPLPVIWEKIPFSFIADWFVPIGTYLDNVSYASSLSSCNWARSTKSSLRGVRPSEKCGYRVPLYSPHTSWCSPANPKDRFSTHNTGSCEYENVWLSRTTGTGISVPVPSFKNLDRVFSLGHLENAAALINGFIRRS